MFAAHFGVDAGVVVAADADVGADADADAGVEAEAEADADIDVDASAGADERVEIFHTGLRTVRIAGPYSRKSNRQFVSRYVRMSVT